MNDSCINNIDVGKGQKIVMIEEQFPSNYYSWERLANESGGVLEVVAAPEELINRVLTFKNHFIEPNMYKKVV